MKLEIYSLFVKPAPAQRRFRWRVIADDGTVIATGLKNHVTREAAELELAVLADFLSEQVRRCGNPSADCGNVRARSDS